MKIVVVSALWCPSCLILKKHIKKLQEDYKNIDIEILDYDFDEDKIKSYDVKDKLPVMIILDDSMEKARLIGEKTYNEIIDFLKENNAI